MSIIFDSDLIIAFRDMLKNNTEAGSSVFAWRKGPTDISQLPYINITTPNSSFERGDTGGRGADYEERQLAIIAMVKGSDEEQEDSDGEWVIRKLDVLGQQILNIVDFDSQPGGLPSGVMNSRLSEIHTERENTTTEYAVRYYILTLRLKYSPNRR